MKYAILLTLTKHLTLFWFDMVVNEHKAKFQFRTILISAPNTKLPVMMIYDVEFLIVMLELFIATWPAGNRDYH